MNINDQKSLNGSWVEKATEKGGEIRQSTERSTEWIFTSDGKATYKHHDLKKISTTMDDRERLWVLRNEKDDAFIDINNEPTYRIISLDGKKMLAENLRNNLIYHFEKQW